MVASSMLLLLFCGLSGVVSISRRLQLLQFSNLQLSFVLASTASIEGGMCILSIYMAKYPILLF